MKSKSIVAALLTSVLLSCIPLNANAAAKPKCTGKNLASYKKNLGIYNREYAEFLRFDDPNGFEAQNYSRAGLAKLRSDSLYIWLKTGGYLEKYAKICKVKMPPEWLELLDSLPDQ
jgi:hypothetical protein